MGELELGKVLIYQNEKGDTRIDVYFEGDTIWMSQKSLAELYQVLELLTIKLIREWILLNLETHIMELQ